MNYRLDYSEAVAYTDAMEYLIQHFPEFPASVPLGGPAVDISVPYHRNHCFVLTTEGEIVFGDCIIPGINAKDFNEYRQKVTLCQGDNR